jgi:hypothetical protein
MDALANFLLQKIDEVGLFVVEPLILNFTLRNHRAWNGDISKRLNKFIIVENIVDNVGRIIS